MILTILLLLVSAIANSVVDKIQHHYHNSIFSILGRDNWWNPEISWNNKYRYITETSSKFEKWLHTSLLVVFTDAFHFFKSIRDNSLLILICLYLPYHFILSFIVVKVLYSTTFYVFYKHLLNKN